MPHICGGSGCHSCARMKGPNNEVGPYPHHPDAHMQCRNIQSGALSLVQIFRDTVLSLLEIMMLLHQLSYAIKTQLKTPTRAFLFFRFVFIA